MPIDETPAAPETGGDVAAPEAPADAAPFEWDGQDFDALEKQDFWKGVPDPVKSHLRTHADRHTFYRTLADSDESVATLTKEMDGLRSTLGAEVTKYKGEAESWKKKYDDIETEYTGFKSEVSAAEHDRKDAHVRETYPDIHATWKTDDDNRMDSPYAHFVRLVEHQGYTMDRAAKAVRAMFDLPAPGAEPAKPAEPPPKPKTREVEPPPSVAMQARDGLNPAETTRVVKPPSPEEARRRLLEKIEQEEAASNG